MSSMIPDPHCEGNENTHNNVVRGQLATALQEIAGAADKIQIRIGNAAYRCRLGYSRTYEIWYGRARKILPEEYAAIASALEKTRREKERNELQEIKVRLARLEARLAGTDEDFHWADISALRALAGGAR